MAKRPPLPRPLPVKDLVREVLGPGDREALELRQKIRQVWDAVVPETLRCHARLVDVRRKELWVEVSASAWSQELQFLKPRILEELARVLGPDRIRELRIQVGEGF